MRREWIETIAPIGAWKCKCKTNPYLLTSSKEALALLHYKSHSSSRGSKDSLTLNNLFSSRQRLTILLYKYWSLALEKGKYLLTYLIESIAPGIIEKEELAHLPYRIHSFRLH